MRATGFKTNTQLERADICTGSRVGPKLTHAGKTKQFIINAYLVFYHLSHDINRGNAAMNEPSIEQSILVCICLIADGERHHKMANHSRISCPKINQTLDKNSISTGAQEYFTHC